MIDRPDSAFSSPPIDLREAKGTIVGGHGTMINIDASVRAREFTHVSIAPPLPLNQRNKRLHLRGRDDLVERLVALLKEPESYTPEMAGSSHPHGGDARLRVRLLYGPGGCGKTSIAEQLAYEVIKRYQVEVWWVNAVDQAALETSMKAVASKVGPLAPDLGGSAATSDVLWQGLMSRDEPWLLVVDGVDDPSVLAVGGRELSAGTGWIRPLSHGPGLVVVTSRDSTVTTWGDWWERHAIGMLSPKDGADVLLDYTADRSIQTDVGEPVSRAGTRLEAEALADRLGGLPLALKLAGSFLALTSASLWPDGSVTTFTGYTKALDAGRVHHLPDDEQDIVRLCGLSLQLLERRGILHARSLLGLLAYLADAPIPGQVLQPTALAASALFSGLNGLSLQLAVDSLASLGLVDLIQTDFPTDAVGGEPTGQSALIILHPLVRYFGRHGDEIARQMTTYLAVAADLLHLAVQRCGDPEDLRSWWYLLAPHCTYFLHACTTDPELDVPAITISLTASAAHDGAVYLYTRGLYEQAEAEFRTVLDVRRQLPDDNDNTVAILDTRYWLACALRDRDLEDRGQLMEVERELRAVYEERALLLSDKRWDLREVFSQLVHTGWNTAEGLELLDRDWQSGAAKPVLDMLDSYEQLAITLAYQNRESSEAKAMYQAVYEARRRILGDNHPATLDTRISLAVRLYYEGQLEEAEAEFRVVYEAQQQIPELGHNHLSTVVSHAWIAEVLRDRGLLEDAEAEFRAVYQARARIFGDEHRETLITRYSLAKVLRDRGLLEDAEAEFRAVLDGERRALGDEHRETLITRYSLANVLVGRGRLLVEAGPSQSSNMKGSTDMPDRNDSPRDTSWFEHALAAFQEALGLIDPDKEPQYYGIVLHDIAQLHIATSDFQKAAASYRESVEHKRLGNNSSDLATTMLALSDCLIDCDELTEARTTLDRTKDLLAKDADNMEPAERAVRVHRLGMVYERLGNHGQEDSYGKALEVYKNALELVNAEVDPGSYATVLNDIGDVHRAQARLSEAHAFYEKAVEYMRRRDGAEGNLASMLLDLGRVRLQIGKLEVKTAPTGEDKQSGLAFEPVSSEDLGNRSG